MRRVGFLAALCACLLIAPAANAQEALDLNQAVLLARDNSLAAQQSRQLLQGAHAQRQVTVGNALPTLSLQTSANYNRLPAGSGFGSIGGGLVGFPSEGVTVDTTVQGSVVLFDAFATRDAIKIADYNIQVSELQLAQAEQDAMTNAAVAYFDVLRSEGLADVAQKTVEQAQEHLRLGNLRLKAGLATRADVQQLRAQLANAQDSLAQTRNAVNLARLTLANALNAPVGDRPLVDNPSVPALDVALERSLKEALERRPELQQAATRTQIDETQVSLNSRQLWPNLQGTTRYSMRGLNEGQFLAGVNLNWQLFDGFKVRNQMEVARNQAQADQLALEQTRQRLALDLRQQVQNQQQARVRVATTREGLAAAQDAYRLMLKRYNVGLSTLFELIDSQTTLVQSSNNYIQASNDLRVAQIRLARALGIDIATYLSAK